MYLGARLLVDIPAPVGSPDYRERARGVQAFEETSKDSPLPREGTRRRGDNRKFSKK